jgi:hypothetical protein
MFTSLSYHYHFTPDIIMNMPFGVIGAYLEALSDSKNKQQEPTSAEHNKAVFDRFGIK